ncbi:MAG: hypothetical protein K0U93_27075 [Gammaproteobacteria bacterium]|nr:hypothetical protein [Gammaproteobacteria bacterium]
MDRRARRCIAIALVTSLCLSGCSAIRLAYDRLDWLAMNYIEDYFELEAQQRGQLAESFEARLNAHRTEELDRIITVLDRAEELAKGDASLEEIHALVDETRAIFVDTMRRTIPYLAPTLASVENYQITHLENGFSKMNEEFVERYTPDDVSARKAARLERFENRFEFWAGDPNEEQRALMKKAIDAAPDIYTLWFADRKRQQRELIEAVRIKSSQQQIEQLLEQWWVSGVRRDPELDQRYARTRQIYAQLLYDLDRTLTPSQREEARSQMRSIKDSLRKAQQDQ